MSNRLKLPQARREEIKEVVLRVFEKSRIDELPVVLADVLRAYGISCVTFEFAASHGVTMEGSGDGFTVAHFNGSKYEYTIVYNADQIKPRVRWTIAHELGHIFLGHADGSVRHGDLEAEANYFARELLSPLSVLDELGARTPSAVASACGLSYEAAALRAADFDRRDAYKARHGNTANDLRFLAQFMKMFKEEIAEEFAALAA